MGQHIAFNSPALLRIYNLPGFAWRLPADQAPQDKEKLLKEVEMRAEGHWTYDYLLQAAKIAGHS